MRVPLRTLIMAAALSLGSTACAQSDEDGVVMHRTAAGQLDGSGWTDAASTGGGFSVRMPCRFNDFTVDAGEEVVSKLFTIGCARTDGSKFSANRLAYRDGAAGAQRLFNEARKAAPMLKFDNETIITTEEYGERECGLTRMIRAGQDNILMVVEAEEGPACNGLGLVARQFFETVKVGER